MADYKELLRRAVEALPANNGAARRAVYEKARAALVGQLRAINPPLPARDITTHRLQLEDCIRQVEQESSEVAIAAMGTQEPAPAVAFEVAKAALKTEIASAGRPDLAKTKSGDIKPGDVKPAGAKPAEAKPGRPGSIEDIIAAADADGDAARRADPGKAGKPADTRKIETRGPELRARTERPEAEPARAATRPVPSIVERAEAAKGKAMSTAFGIPAGKPYEGGRRSPVIEPRRESGPVLAARQGSAEPDLSRGAPVAAAMSSVREVEVEPPSSDPQGAIDRAIATLDREARGDAEPQLNGVHYNGGMGDEMPAAASPNGKGLMGSMFGDAGRRVALKNGDAEGFSDARPSPKKAAQRGRGELAFPRAQPENDRGIGAVTIFLVVFVLLLAGAGGAGYWAWQEGYINLDAMFGRGQPVTQEVAAAVPASEAAAIPAVGPGNTDTPTPTADPANALKAVERLPESADTPPAEATSAEATPAEVGTAPLALQAGSPDNKTEERLSTDASAETAAVATASVDPASATGSQSLLLEASEDGTTGAVPFSGTVDWSRGTDETGQPTLVGKANIPARNLSVDLLIRKNSDPSLPASHVMEINFSVSDSFIGGSIAGLPGVLLKNEELVQGAPLIGASARVVGNSFLFALSASGDDSAANEKLLTSRKWMDLALIYATGKRAIITLEKDNKAQTLFTEVFANWDKAASN